MTIYADLSAAEPSAPDASRRRWRRRLFIGVAALLVVLLGLWVGWWEYADHYQPLGLPGMASTGSPDLSFKQLNDGAGETRLTIVGPQGKVASVTYALANRGRYDVRLLGGPDGKDFMHMTLRWAPADPHQALAPATDAMPFPMTLHAHQAIQLWLFVTQPACTPGGGYDINGFGIRWSALGHSHWYTYPLTVAGINEPIVLCDYYSHSSTG